MHVNSYRYFGSAPKAIDISQEGGILGIGFGSHIQFWKNCTSVPKDTFPFLTHELPGTMIESLKFRPYEDFCYLGLNTGIDTMIVPGSGLANFDSHRANPYETPRVRFLSLYISTNVFLIVIYFFQQRREKEIHSLLDKLPADTITYDPSKLGLLDEAPRNVICEEEDLKRLQLQEEKEKKTKKRFLKNKTSALREKVKL
jgi:U3 small nucleolar RNA-associated protein 7